MTDGAHRIREPPGSIESRRSSAGVVAAATARAASSIMPSVTCVAPAAMEPSPMPALQDGSELLVPC